MSTATWLVNEWAAYIWLRTEEMPAGLVWFLDIHSATVTDDQFCRAGLRMSGDAFDIRASFDLRE